MKTIIILIFLCALLMLIFLLFKNFFLEKKERENFIQYTKNKNDISILYELGYCDKTGFEELRRVPFRDKILIEHYKNNNDEKYLVYAKYIKNISFKIIIIALLIFVCVCVITCIF